MYPNPQDALPLPSRPDLQQYKKLAKDLVKACRSGDPAAIRLWAERWITALAAAHREPTALHNDTEIASRAESVGQYAQRKLSHGGQATSKCALADAQFAIARAHGFLSWPKFATHIESLVSASSPISAFEAAVSAIVSCTTSPPTASKAIGRSRQRTSLGLPRSCLRLARRSTRRRMSTAVDARRWASWPRALHPPLQACSSP